MAEILGAATTATKLFLEVNQISIDNWAFKLFYKATTTILLGCSVIATSKQFFGDPISCEVSGGGVNDGVLQAYCWMYSTFNIPMDFKGACIRREHDGVTLYNSYYQWVSIFLVLSALLFYVPRAVWLMMEGGLMKYLAKGTTDKVIEHADQKRLELLQTFKEHLHNKYNSYAMGFLVCEQLNFLVVLSQWFITHKFLKYKFLDYGPSVVQYYRMPEDMRELQHTNPMCEAFPRIAACNYVRFGSGGGHETKNAICILGLNMINDKIFLVIWFWYLFLTLFGVIIFIYRTLQLSTRFRFYVMKIRIHRYFKTNSDLKHIQHYLQQCSYGDWFVLYQMSRNMNRRFFSEFLAVLSRQIEPCPDVAAEEEGDLDPRKGGQPPPDGSDGEGQQLHQRIKRSDSKRHESGISLHSQAVDLCYE